MNQHFYTRNGVTIYSESFGNQHDPTLLLIMGAQSSLVWWEEDFCKQLAAAGRFVIRFDHRDVGRSTTYECGKPSYTFVDMVDDVVGLLDDYRVKKAHIVGMSMGGMLTQMLALRYPERVSSITLLATSNFASGLPPMEQKVIDFFEKEQNNVDWSNKQAVVDMIVRRAQLQAGSKHPFQKERISRIAAEEWDRSNAIASMVNHTWITGGEEYLTRTSEMNVSTLVIHGTADPVIPYQHGLMLAKSIPQAKLVTLEGAGHELHRNDWDKIITSIIKHTAKKE